MKRVVWLTPDGQEMAGVVRGAVSVNQTLLTPPQAYRNVRITPPEMARLSRRAQHRLADFYVGSRLAFWRVTARQLLNPNDLHWGKTGAWMTWYRVTWIHLGELAFLPGSSTATANASAELRSNRGDINRLDYTFHMVSTPMGWRIDREQFDFQPGYGP